jgi:hypothetical protein
MTGGNKENVPPPGTPGMPDPAAQRATAIINQIMTAGQWGTVKGSAIVPQANNMWELRIHFTTGNTRRVRIGGDGTVSSDTTSPTQTLT